METVVLLKDTVMGAPKLGRSFGSMIFVGENKGTMPILDFHHGPSLSHLASWMEIGFYKFTMQTQ